MDSELLYTLIAAVIVVIIYLVIRECIHALCNNFWRAVCGECGDDDKKVSKSKQEQNAAQASVTTTRKYNK